MMFVATINVPGYMPDSAEPPPEFDNADDAWEYLAQERRESEEFAAMNNEDLLPFEGYSETVSQLEMLATGIMDEYENYGVNMNGEGVIYADTPGHDVDYDLGLVYSVSEVEG